MALHMYLRYMYNSGKLGPYRAEVLGKSASNNALFTDRIITVPTFPSHFQLLPTHYQDGSAKDYELRTKELAPPPPAPTTRNSVSTNTEEPQTTSPTQDEYDSLKQQLEETVEDLERAENATEYFVEKLNEQYTRMENAPDVVTQTTQNGTISPRPPVAITSLELSEFPRSLRTRTVVLHGAPTKYMPGQMCRWTTRRSKFGVFAGYYNKKREGLESPPRR
ncbi:hypothetical protein L211DRAFT_870842 [Terfezia boudieri ATCC MYA-4762]|uniref:Uncharacterized protein n=1 Tax=Terfezia boudieri ATCC MYA-4762 TaxID=1051890 RepID=A0A3N4LEQ0_9PEZI|nr:hypothetical protein L211DRAFT_870842 [Terfezia boudieri ATCC MYA-4762]